MSASDARGVAARDGLLGRASSTRLHGLLAGFASSDALVTAARRVHDAGYTRWDAYAPYPVKGLAGAVGLRASRLPWLALAGGIVGAAVGLLLPAWAHTVAYPVNLSGKPLVSLPAYVPVAFELSILSAAVCAVVGMLVAGGLLCWFHPLFTQPPFAAATTDGFFICIEAADPIFDARKARTLLESLGGTGIQRVEAPAPSPVPRWLRRIGIAVTFLALIPPALIVRARYVPSTAPRVHLIHDMDHQEKAGPQSAHAGFEDGRAMRPPVRGTVARDDRPPDEHFENGRVDGEWATTMPMPVTLPFSLRGRDRYRIYCATCHGPDGAGRGPTAIRAEELQEPTWVAPKSFVDPDVLPQPVGQVFGTITAGVRTMPAFNELIPPDDRWAIVAHVRELQKELTARRPENRNTETRWGGEGLNTD